MFWLLNLTDLFYLKSIKPQKTYILLEQVCSTRVWKEPKVAYGSFVTSASPLSPQNKKPKPNPHSPIKYCSSLYSHCTESVSMVFGGFGKFHYVSLVLRVELVFQKYPLDLNNLAFLWGISAVKVLYAHVLGRSPPQSQTSTMESIW